MVKNTDHIQVGQSNDIKTKNINTTMKNYITSSESLEWKPLLEEGVDTKGIFIKILHFDQTTKRAPTFLLKFEAGTSYPYHNHPRAKKLLYWKVRFILTNIN